MGVPVKALLPFVQDWMVSSSGTLAHEDPQPLAGCPVES